MKSRFLLLLFVMGLFPTVALSQVTDARSKMHCLGGAEIPSLHNYCEVAQHALDSMWVNVRDKVTDAMEIWLTIKENKTVWVSVRIWVLKEGLPKAPGNWRIKSELSITAEPTTSPEQIAEIVKKGIKPPQASKADNKLM